MRFVKIELISDEKIPRNGKNFVWGGVLKKMKPMTPYLFSRDAAKKLCYLINWHHRPVKIHQRQFLNKTTVVWVDRKIEVL